MAISVHVGSWIGLIVELVVALTTTQGGGETCGKGTDQQRNEEPQRRVGRCFSRFVSCVFCGDFGVANHALRALEGGTDALFSVGLRQTGSL